MKENFAIFYWMAKFFLFSKFIREQASSAMFCDRIYALKEGRIIAQGTPREVLTEDFIRQVYQVDAEIAKDSSGQMHILFKG